MRRITAIIGDYHAADPIRGALQQAISQADALADVSLRFIEAGRLADALAEQPDAVVLFKEDRVAPQDDEEKRWMTQELAAGIERYVREGGGWLAWHSGLASYDPNGAYVRMLRGHFLHHPHEHQIVRYMPETADDVELANQPFELLDEHYFIACDEASTQVFLRSTSVDGDSIAGWRHSYGDGRVCCLTPAHLREGLANEGFLRVLGNALQWCMKGK